MMPLWVSELAEEFWHDAGGPPPFPRKIYPALISGPHVVAVKQIAKLSIHKAENHLAHMGIHHRSGEQDRPLRACVAARDGAAWVFLDADDGDDEKNASLAHEV